MNELKIILLKPHVKAVILAVFTIIIGIVSGILVNNLIKWYLWLAIILIAFVYLWVLIVYTKLEENQQSQLKAISDAINDNAVRVKVLQSVLQGVSTVNKLSAKQTNFKIHEIIEEGKIYCNNWNFDIASTLVCEQIHNHAISKICNIETLGGFVDIEVAYVCLEDTPPKKHNERIRMCGFFHPSSQSPSIYHVTRSIKRVDKHGKLYYDAQIFQEKRNAINILIDKSSIAQNFGFLREDNDYCQFIGVPVFCESVSGSNKMIGLLEIACHNECYLGHDEAEIKDHISQYISPYLTQLLLLYKSDKALRAVPQKSTVISEAVTNEKSVV